MKHQALALVLATLCAAPIAALASETTADSLVSDNVRLQIVDARTGVTLAELVPIDGQRGVLRIIREANARGNAPTVVRAPAAPSALTVQQQEAAYQRARDAQFGIDHSP